MASGLKASDVFEIAMAEGAATMAATMKQSSELAKAEAMIIGLSNRHPKKGSIARAIERIYIIYIIPYSIPMEYMNQYNIICITFVYGLVLAAFCFY